MSILRAVQHDLAKRSDELETLVTHLTGRRLQHHIDSLLVDRTPDTCRPVLFGAIDRNVGTERRDQRIFFGGACQRDDFFAAESLTS